MRQTRRALCATVLTLEAITLGLSTPVMITIADVRPGAAVTVGMGLLVLCVLAAGMLRTRAGYLLGHAVQVGAIALGFLIPLMFFLGAVFALLWGTAYWLGSKIERERAEAYAAHERAHGGSHGQ